MRFLAAATFVGVAIAAPASPTASDTADVHAAQATARTSSHTSHVKGQAFDRYVSIWFENTDFDMAAADPNFQFFAKKGITLLNNFAVTHPSEPNYMASVGGDYFGLDGDPFTQVPENISSVVDLLEDKGISWSMYEEDMPYTGYQGFDWVNQQNGANDYVRKHNPEVLYNSVVTNSDRLTNIKNTTIFYEDLKANKLPQWMFITPNMTSDGHDTSVTVAGKWLRTFLEPLLDDKNFMQNTMVLITFDENETYTIQNRVFSVLLGDAVPQKLVGTTDSNYYNHYSEIATVEANWCLDTLGRWDVGANVFSNVAAHTGDQVRTWNSQPDFEHRYFNYSYPGIFNSEKFAVQPVPDTSPSDRTHRATFPGIQKQWETYQKYNYYHGQLEIPDGYNPPAVIDYSS
ncbi:Phosphate-repressible acid phosphatase [Lachnellula occidentalis]|uniref:Phosphate-repressible acid phosphatase n=1 Tax=Lachnellula occidentalis TaxID=215460 RepID=A0A8H8RQL8_9HELO|nr:Phosphate-repressible acid phosphatase [Lachnellula occidentalis]